MNYYAEAYGEVWELGHKVTFDYYKRLIIVAPGVTSLDVKTDLYSDMKEWFLLPDRRNRKFRPPIRVIGGDDTIAGQKAGDIYFTQHGWRVVYNPSETSVSGVLFSDDFDTAWLDQSSYQLGFYKPVYPALVSSLVTGVDIEAVTAPSADTVAGAVRDELSPELANMDTTVSSRATQTSVDAVQGDVTAISANLAGKASQASVDAMQADIDALQIALAGNPQEVWENIVAGTFPSGSAGERLQQLLSTANFLALK